MFEKIFYISLILIMYAYFGYPLSLYIIGFISKKKHVVDVYFPAVTVIITAFNEENRIESKILNTLNIKYPKDKLQIIIASDGSTDSTNRISENYQHLGIELLAISVRAGKESAQKEAVKIAKGEIIVFTDVATIIEPSGIEKIVSNFADQGIGCVSSEDRLVDRDGNPSGEGFYVRYEMLLRRLESRVNSLVGLSGSFFAARKSVCQDFSADMQSDFRTLLNSIKMGLRGISDPEVTGSYLDVSAKSREFDRKVRTVLRGITVYFNHLEYLNVLKYGFFSYQYFCHKLLRWLVPLFLILTLLSNMVLAMTSTIFLIIFILQVMFYVIALMGWRTTGASLGKLNIPYYFLTVNVSILIAWMKYFRRQRVVMWTPSER